MRMFLIGSLFGALLIAPWYISLILAIILLIKYEDNLIVVMFAFVFDVIFRSSDYEYFSMPATLLMLILILVISLSKSRLWPVIN